VLDEMRAEELLEAKDIRAVCREEHSRVFRLGLYVWDDEVADGSMMDEDSS
jgi:hypothetical protein